MQIELNGVEREFPDGTTLVQLIELLELSGRRIALERNGAIVPRSSHARQVIEEGDRIEIVHAVGGG